MVSAWKAIAKAELLVSTARLRRSRKLLSLIIFSIVAIWALYLAPQLMRLIVTRFAEEFEAILALSFPGLMRSLMLFLWLFLLIVPLSNALEEVKIGQWEIMLSNNVRTRDMLIGTFIAKLPIYSTVILVIAPVMISPFVYVYEISVLGQVMIYSVVTFVSIASIWLSNIIAAYIQSKLGQSSRGNDIAKALSWALIPFVAIPGMAIGYFMPQVAEMMGGDASLLLPSTWSADLITWITITETGAGLPSSWIMAISNWLTLNAAIDFALLLTYGFLLILVGLYAADRYFALAAGARTETVVTVGRENIFLRGLRRVFSGDFGVVVVTSLKDFGRKAQNLSKLGYSIFLSILMPIVLRFSGTSNQIGDPLVLPTLGTMMIALMLAVFSAVTFGGVGFLDSRDQLWILKSTPKGSLRFIGARVASYFLLAIPYALLPSVSVSLIMSFNLMEAITVFIIAYLSVCGAIMVGIGVTTSNPSYSDTKSSSFTINSVATVMITIISTMVGLIFGVIAVIEERSIMMGFYLFSIPLPLIGIIVLILGSMRLIRLEAA